MAPGHIYFFDQHYPKESYTYTYTHTHCSLPNIHISRAFLPYVCMHVLHRCVPYTLICFLECREHTCINIHVALFHTYIYVSHTFLPETPNLSFSLSPSHTHLVTQTFFPFTHAPIFVSGRPSSSHTFLFVTHPFFHTTTPTYKLVLLRICMYMYITYLVTRVKM